MGLTDSKLNAEELMRPRVNSDDLFKKQSLKTHNVEDDNSSQSHSGNQSVDETIFIVTVQKSVVPLPETENQQGCDIGSMEQDKEHDRSEREKHDDDKLAEIIIQIDEKKTQENEHRHEEIVAGKNDADDEGGEEEEAAIGRLEYPGSPSFRIYCVESQTKSEDDQSSKEEAKAKARHQKSASITLHPGNPSANCWGRKSEPPKRKLPRKMKFAAVLKFLRTKGGCYYPSCTCTCSYVPKEPF